ncbi:MAG: CsgG/HfaB family protein [Pseudomonadota bacterium]
MLASKFLPCLLIASGVFALSGCATMSSMEMGSSEAKTAATGAAGGSNSQNENKGLEKCSAPLGTIGVLEDTNASWYSLLTQQYHLGSTVPVLKLLIQQSNCFVVVERGRGMEAMNVERKLQESGELRKKSNFGKGQVVSADYTLIPSVTFSNQDAGRSGVALGGLLGPVGAAIGGSLSSKEASTVLTIMDNRSSVQLAAAEGSAKNIDFGFMGGIVGGLGGGAGGGYANTAQGKVIVAAFTDSMNNVIRAVKNYKAQEVKGGLGTGGNLAVQGAEKEETSAVSNKKKKAKKK